MVLRYSNRPIESLFQTFTDLMNRVEMHTRVLIAWQHCLHFHFLKGHVGNAMLFYVLYFKLKDIYTSHFKTHHSNNNFHFLSNVVTLCLNQKEYLMKIKT